MPKKIEISHKTIIFTVFFLILLRFLLQIAEILFWLYIAFILMAALKPMVDSLEKYKIPRILAILIIYILVLLFIIFAGGSIIPPLVNQTINLLQKLPDYLSLVMPFISADLQTVARQVAPIGENLLRLSVGIFNNIIAIFTIFMITFYLLLERKNLDDYLNMLFGNEISGQIISVINKVEERLGDWVRGQLTLLLTIGIFTYIGLFLLGVPYALPLAIFAGLLEIVPNIGPVVSAVPAIIVAVTVSSLHAVLTVVFYIVIQQLENQIMVPMVMRRVVGLPPLVTILSLMIGAKIGGIPGAIMAVPVVVTIEAIFTQYFKLKEGAAKKNIYGSS